MGYSTFMFEPLLSTKLTPPPLPTECVNRPRLVQLLQDSLKRKLTVISAPAGFGKTTLLSEMLQSCGGAIAWLAIDEDDNDPVRFLRYLAAALSRAGVTAQIEDAQALLAPLGCELQLAAWINQITDCNHSILLALDDYHRISAQPVHDLLAYLLDHQPPNLHLIIATRADPPLPLARLRARGQLVELRLNDLRFTAPETIQFLNLMMGLNLSETDITALLARTEGWVAGLQIAAISLQHRSDPSTFIRAFTGSHRYVLDYLVEEVLERQPAELRSFLYQTAILNQMCGPLCEAVVTGLAAGQGQKMLEVLERLNLFVIPLDDQRQWYRYHRLFSDLLQRELASGHGERPGQSGETIKQPSASLQHIRASVWYESQGMLSEAIDHALSGADYERAANLIEATAEPALMSSQTFALMRWIQALPVEQLDTHPKLHIYRAQVLLFSGRPVGMIWEALAACQGAQIPAEQVEILAAPVKALLSLYQGQYEEALSYARQALSGLAESERFSRSIAGWIINLEGLLTNQPEIAARFLEQFSQSSQQAGNIVLTVLAACSLANIQFSQGRTEQAESTYRRALELARDPSIIQSLSLTGDEISLPAFPMREGTKPRLPIAGLPLRGLGEILRERNELDRAIPALREAIELFNAWQGFGIYEAYYSLEQAYLGQGDLENAAAIIQQATQLAIQFDASQIDDRIVAIAQVYLWLAQGDLVSARLWLDNQLDFPPPLNAGVFEEHLQQHEQIQRSRVLIVFGRGQEALALLEPILSSVKKDGRKRRMVEILALMAMAHASSSEDEEALNCLQHALYLAQAGGLIRILLDEGEPMRLLLQKATGLEGVADYARFLLDQYSSRAPHPKPLPSKERETFALGGEGEIAPLLTARQLEVLHCLASGLSNQQIADRLFISLRTVKFHTGKIFSKLGVQTRTQAIARLRKMEDESSKNE